MPIAAISKYHRSTRYLALATFFLGFATLAYSDVVRAPLQSGVFLDMGQVREAPETGARHLTLQRTGVSLTQVIDVDEHLLLVVGIGGLFFNSFPEDAQDYRRSLKFGPGVGQAQGIYTLGKLENPWGRLRFGLIPYKYNPDAKNLGEYLLRSTAYPNILVTGGFSIINSASMMVQGVDFEVRTGPVTHNFLMSIERSFGIEPTGDITPAYLFTYKPHPSIELGGGVAFAHLIPVKPSVTTPNGKDGEPFTRYKSDTIVTDPNDSVYSNFTYKATKLMARASVNFQTLLKSDLLGPEDLKLYAEASVLGWKDYPFYYSDRWHRIPVMVGFNLPTFKLLDILAVEGEYRKADFINSTSNSYDEYHYAVPTIEGSLSDSHLFRLNSYYKNALCKGTWYRTQGFKWSVYAKRNIIPGITVFAQVASDHNRPYKFNSEGALVPNREPLTVTPGDWYYLIRLQLGI